jgi:hypothetical protein
VCTTVIDTTAAAGTGYGVGRCPEHGLVNAVYGSRDAILAAQPTVVQYLQGDEAQWGKSNDELEAEHSVRVARPDYDPHVDYPERYSDGRPI